MAAPPGAELAEVWKSLAGIGVPADALAAAAARLPQRGHDGLEPAAACRRARRPALSRPPLRRPDWAANPVVGLPRRDVPAQRAHAAAAWPRASRATRRRSARIRFAVQQWIDAAAPSNFLALNPEAQKKAIETKGESLAARPDASSGTTCSRATCRRPTRARSRSAATSRRPKARWCSRTSFFQLIEYKPLTRQGARAADAVRAAVHQQVLHPRPAARELADPPHGRRRATASSS